MPKFAVNLSMLFTELPLVERFAAAAKQGFKHVEIQFPYELPIETIRTQLEQHGLQLILINIPAGDWANGDRGIACLPDRQTEFRAGVELAREYAQALQVPQVNCLSGIAPETLDYSEAEQTFLENIAFAVETFETAGVRVLMEAINTQDIPGFWLNNSQQAFEIIKKLDKLNVSFQYDVYHMQIMEGDLINTLRTNLEQIAHIQIADVPGRHEPGTGEINFPNLFKALDAMGYSGFVSLEYNPVGQTIDGLRWLSQTDQ